MRNTFNIRPYTNSGKRPISYYQQIHVQFNFPFQGVSLILQAQSFYDYAILYIEAICKYKDYILHSANHGLILRNSGIFGQPEKSDRPQNIRAFVSSLQTYHLYFTNLLNSEKKKLFSSPKAVHETNQQSKYNWITRRRPVSLPQISSFTYQHSGTVYMNLSTQRQKKKLY